MRQEMAQLLEGTACTKPWGHGTFREPQPIGYRAREKQGKRLERMAGLADQAEW